MFSAFKTLFRSYGIQQLHHEHLRSATTSIRNVSHLPSPSPAIFLTNVIHDSDPSTFCMHPTSASKPIMCVTSVQVPLRSCLQHLLSQTTFRFISTHSSSWLSWKRYAGWRPELLLCCCFCRCLACFCVRRFRELCVCVQAECTRVLSFASPPPSPPPAETPPSLSSPSHHLQQPDCAQSLINACLTSGNSAAATLAGVFNGLLQRHTSILQVISCIFIFLNCKDARVLKLHAALLENDTTHDIAAEALGDAAALKMLRCHDAYVVNFSFDTWETRCKNAVFFAVL